MDFKLQGKVALVTGAGSQKGFGKAIALTLAKEGCDVIVNDINLEDAKKTAAEVEAIGRKSLAVKADVTSKAEVDAMVKEALAKFGKIDILVNNAGAIASKVKGPFVNQPEEDWDNEISMNLKSAMLCCKAVLPGMMEHKYGKIVNISSDSAKMVNPDVSAYAIAKGGVMLFTRQLARPAIASGINVNSVSPGWGLTNFGGGGNEEAMKKFLVPITPIGRATDPQDIANTVTFLVSDVSVDIVGQVINVDGGLVME
ncbi:MAG: SDR family oxidoreductase [Dehalococcoidales bacterium]|nr:SDR family oxidoreductase [Dehalococcoidales bacterium]